MSDPIRPRVAWLQRSDLEDRENRDLVAPAALAREAAERRIDEPADPMRTAFQRDRDRVIHSTAFRRLQHKTQVLAATDGDHHRSRMTHSLEVSQMARGACHALRLNADLAEAIALAHDLGHPPFGHAGERALDELMANHGGFRHNAQGARIVDLLEDRYGHGHGLNLTFAVRRSLLKGRIPPDFPLSDDLWSALDTGHSGPRAESGRPAPIEARVVDCCDRIAYLCHDLDDGLRAGLLAFDEVTSLSLWRAAAATARRPHPGGVISEMVARMVHDLVEASAHALAAPGDSVGIRHGEAITVQSQELLEFLRTRFYRHPDVLERMGEGAARIRAVFADLRAAPENLPVKVRARVEAEGLERTVCDYVSGMTDRFLLGHSSGPT